MHGPASTRMKMRAPEHSVGSAHQSSAELPFLISSTWGSPHIVLEVPFSLPMYACQVEALQERSPQLQPSRQASLLQLLESSPASDLLLWSLTEQPRGTAGRSERKLKEATETPEGKYPAPQTKAEWTTKQTKPQTN